MASFFAKLPDSFRTRQKRPGSQPGATDPSIRPDQRERLPAAAPGVPVLNDPGRRADISKRSRIQQRLSPMSILQKRGAAPSRAFAGGHPILLVEDDHGQALLVEQVFRRAGVANPLQVFHEGYGALAYLEGKESYADRKRFPLPVLILLDLHVPGRSGLEVLTCVRSQPDLSGIPVVMLSGSSESEDIDRAFELGADSYLVKPVAFDALLDTVSGLGLPWMILARVGEGGDG